MQVWTAGQVIGLIHDIPTCAKLLTRIENEATVSMLEISSLCTDSQGSIPIKSGDGITGENVNDPAAELWGVGKSKL